MDGGALARGGGDPATAAVRVGDRLDDRQSESRAVRQPLLAPLEAVEGPAPPASPDIPGPSSATSISTPPTGVRAQPYGGRGALGSVRPHVGQQVDEDLADPSPRPRWRTSVSGASTRSAVRVDRGV